MPYIGNQIFQGIIDSGNIVDGSIQTGDLANSAVTTAKIADSNITSAKIADTGVTVAKLNSDVTQLIAQGSGPKITGVAITNSSWTVLDDTAVDTAGGYIKLTGTNFVTGCTVVVGTTSATAVTFTSSTELRVQLPAQAAGTYILYVTNPDGGTAIRVNAVTYSATPSWVTSSTLPQQDDGVAISIQLSATSATTYALQAGSTLPSGLTLTSGGLLSGTVSGLASDTSYSFTVVATDAELQDSPRAFTVNIVATDPYFNLTTLVINGDTAPNVLTDASSNNFNLTAYGNTRASNFTPYGTGWSNYFNGNGDYLSIPTNAALNLSSGDFTIEGWVHWTGSNAGGTILNKDGVSGSSYPSYLLGLNSSGYFRGAVGSGNGTTYFQTITSSVLAPINQWVHLAFVKNGTTLTLYQNGTNVGSATQTGTIVDGAKAVLIGYETGQTSTVYWSGYISNTRIVKGTAVYTTNFTPATTNLTSVANTSLLTCNANRIVDGSANNFAITRNGDVAVRSFNPFNITNTGTSGSMYFDGDGDYIIGSSGGFLGSGDFTVEMWYYPTTSSFGRGGAQNWGCILFDTRETSSSDASGFLLGITNTGQGQLYLGGGTPGAIAATTNTMRHLEWNHIAAVRIGSTITVYINGIAGSTYTYSTNFLRNRVQISGPYDVLSSTYIMAEGYIADVRSISGTGVYTGNFSIPKLGLLQKSGSASAAVYSNTTNINTTFSDTNCQLLSLQYKQPHNNHSFQDSSTNNHLITRNGNATQGTFSPFSQTGWGNYFNGSSYLLSTATQVIPTGSFTVEAWVYPMVSTDGYIVAQGTSGNAARFSVGIESNVWYAQIGASLVASSAAPVINRWTYIAVTFNGSTLTLYVDGQSVGTPQSTTTSVQNTTLRIGTLGPADWGAAYWTGYISNVRISNTVRSISVPTTPTPFTADANTTFLGCNINRFQYTASAGSFTSLTTGGSPSVVAFSPFKPTASWSAATYGGSGYFDGSGDYLNYTQPGGVGNGDFTLELWLYPIQIGDAIRNVWDCRSVEGGTDGFWLGSDTTNFYMYYASSKVISTSYPTVNAWTHVALVRSGNDHKLYFNGTQVGSTYTAANNYSNTSIFISRYFGSATYYTNGYFSSLRLVKGTAVYTGAFTPPTAPLTAISGTSLLLNFTDAAARDSTGRLVLETVGDSKVSTVQKKYGTGALYFDGTGDYFRSVMTPVLTNLIGVNNPTYTFEAWIYPTSTTNYQRIIDFAGANVAGFAFVDLVIHSGALKSEIKYTTGGTATTISGGTISANTWSHVALVVNSGTAQLYLNGSAVGSTASYSALSGMTGLGIGGPGNTYAVDYFSGYIDDARITQYARYTTNFTPPAQTFKLR